MVHNKMYYHEVLNLGDIIVSEPVEGSEDPKIKSPQRQNMYI